MKLDETVPKQPYEVSDWYTLTESERINALLGMVADLSVVTDRLIEQVVEHEDRIHTLELSGEV